MMTEASPDQLQVSHDTLLHTLLSLVGKYGEKGMIELHEEDLLVSPAQFDLALTPFMEGPKRGLMLELIGRGKKNGSTSGS